MILVPIELIGLLDNDAVGTAVSAAEIVYHGLIGVAALFFPPHPAAALPTGNALKYHFISSWLVWKVV